MKFRWTRLDGKKRFNKEELDKILLPVVNEVVGGSTPIEGKGWEQVKLSDPAAKFKVCPPTAR